nr:transposase [Enterococcus pingfangensis]
MGNIYDSQVAVLLVEKVRRLLKKITTIVANAGYKTPFITKTLIDQEIRPVLPYTRPRGDKELFRKKEFGYDGYYDCYLCPQDKILAFSTVNREGYREYKSKYYQCEWWPGLDKGTKNQSHQKLIIRHVWQYYLDVAADLRLTDINKKIYSRRKETIERVFADGKEKHGMRWTKYSGLEKVSLHTMLIFAAMNLKNLATWLS